MRNRSLEIAGMIVLALIGGALAVAPAFIPPYRPAVASEKRPPDPERDSRLSSIEEAPDAGTGTVARSFIQPERRNAAVEAQDAPASAPAARASVAEWLRPLGLVEDEAGIGRIYLKDDRSGRLVWIRRDGREEEGTLLIEENDQSYLVSIKGSLYIVQRRKK